MSVFNANSVDPDQTPRSAASDLGLHCLPMSLLRNASLKWVKIFVVRYQNVHHEDSDQSLRMHKPI